MGASDGAFAEVVVAAALHDIGKFCQRAGKDHGLSREEVSLYCPYDSENNHFTHLHAAHTVAALMRLEAVFPDPLSGRRIAELAGRHHRPDTVLECVIAEADRISAGQDRTPRERESEGQYFETPLRNVLDKVRIDERPEPERQSAYALQPLEPATAFPGEVRIGREDYDRRWERFCADAAALRPAGLDLEAFLQALDTLLLRYTWCISSTTVDEPDISLYDHLATTAAFAACLYRYHEERGDLDDGEAVRDRKTSKFRFITGDLSGIQRYIFDLKTTQESARLLRARSFELQYLCEHEARAVLRACGLPIHCRMQGAGGRFLLVVPNTGSARRVLDGERARIEGFFLRRYQGELSLNLSHGVEASADDLQRDRARAVFDRIRLDAEEAKQRKLQVALALSSHVLSEDYDAIQARGAVCPACESRAAADDGGACGVCATLTRVGGRLPKARFLGIPTEEARRKPFLSALEDLWLADSPEGLPRDVAAFAVNHYVPGLPAVSMPYHLPRDEHNDRVMTFEDIAKASFGARKLAMLKADLDNLGLVFSRGLGDRVSISRYAAASRLLHYFFSAVVTHEITDPATGQDRFRLVYTVFSGGDDLCLIGPWDVIVDFALHIRRCFRRYVNENPSLTISAGIALADSKLPVRSIAHAAEEALERAKARGTESEAAIGPNGGSPAGGPPEAKNAITVFQTTLAWESCKRMIEAGKRLTELRKEEKIGAGIVHRLIRYSRRAAAFLAGDVTEDNALWRSHFGYDAARNLGDVDPQTREWFVSLADDAQIRDVRAAASYALYRERSQRGEEGERNGTHSRREEP